MKDLTWQSARTVAILSFVLLITGVPVKSQVLEQSPSNTSSQTLPVQNHVHGHNASATPEELVQCVNENQAADAVTGWASAMKVNTTRVEIVKAWWSKKPANLPLTIVTQLSWSRRWQLKALCNSYPGPVSAAIYVATFDKSKAEDEGVDAEVDVTSKGGASDSSPHGMDGTQNDTDTFKADEVYAYTKTMISEGTPMSQVVKAVSALFWSLNSTCACKLDLLLAHEVVGGKSQRLYPVNQLRNYARLQARTPLLALLDVDLIVSSNLSRSLTQYPSAAYFIKQTRSKKVFVLPAFITTQSPDPNDEQKRFASTVTRKTKAQLQNFYETKRIQRFDPTSNGHVATKYSRWFASHDPYKVHYEPRFEPWVICDRRSIPWHDVRFRGYGKNKIIHVQSLHHFGYRFYVHPDVFLVHRPHEMTQVKSQHKRVQNSDHDASSAMYDRNTKLADEVQEQMEANTYEPVLDPATRVCMHTLSWWRQ